MRLTSAINAIAVAAAVGHTAAKAPVVSSNPAGAIYKATVDGDIQASVTAASGIDGYGVVFKVEFEDLPDNEGPFSYHLHAKPVPKDGNCTATAGHLNPYNATATCDTGDLASCEVGDLSGKYGKAKGSKFEATYVDLYASTDPEDAAFFGALSFVIHRSNSSRLACANFELAKSEDGDDCSASHTTSSTATTTLDIASSTMPAQTTAASSSDTSPLPTGAASRTYASAFGMVGAGALLAWVL